MSTILSSITLIKKKKNGHMKIAFFLIFDFLDYHIHSDNWGKMLMEFLKWAALVSLFSL